MPSSQIRLRRSVSARAPDGDLAPERALVTGASGFIGSSLVARLLQHGMDVHAISRTHADGADGPGVRWWQADVADSTAVERVVSEARPSVLLHLAGETRAARELDLVQPTFQTNLAGTVNVLGAAARAGCRRVVLTGSLEEPHDDGEVVPSSPYAASKWAGSAYARMFHKIYGLPVVSLRIFMVYGPGQRDLRKLVPYTILSLLRGEPPMVSSGRREIDWIYVDDVVDAYVAAIFCAGIDGKTLDVGSGALVSVRAIVEQLTRIVAPELEPEFGAVADRPLEQVSAADVARTTALLGWSPTTRLHVGLARTAEWYAKTAGSGSMHVP
jgi:nucleoside-diphosphate-sugar epimerase